MPPEMATRRAEFADMSDEEREAMRAEMEASGEAPRGGGAAIGWFGGIEFRLVGDVVSNVMLSSSVDS